jgi:hypothetical protein
MEEGRPISGEERVRLLIAEGFLLRTQMLTLVDEGRCVLEIWQLETDQREEMRNHLKRIVSDYTQLRVRFWKALREFMLHWDLPPDRTSTLDPLHNPWVSNFPVADFEGEITRAMMAGSFRNKA